MHIFVHNAKLYVAEYLNAAYARLSFPGPLVFPDSLVPTPITVYKISL